MQLLPLLHEKTLSSLGIEGNFFNLMKIMYRKPIANIALNGKKLKDQLRGKGVPSYKSFSTLYWKFY